MPGVDGRDDFLRGDSLQVGAGGREMRMAELALDHWQRNAFVQQLDGVRVAELVGREAPADSGLSSNPMKLEPGGAR